MELIRPIVIVVTFMVLTILTQVGGIVFIGCLLTYKFTTRLTPNIYWQRFWGFMQFLILYCATTFLIVPLCARPFGRVPMPVFKKDGVKPLNILTCLLNRNYVRPALKMTAFDVARQMNSKFPGTTLNYLDASFPFINKFPLVPHLSHNDGKKLDIAFCYDDKRTGRYSNSAPSFIGYGVSEGPRPGEVNTAEFCAQKGYWQYGLLAKIVPQGNKNKFMFDSVRTTELVKFFASEPMIGKIFIEPHLKLRLRLTTSKIRFHGCQAVRHDDHLHVQLL